MKGFTLIELMVSTAILAIILSVGVPAMGRIVESHHSTTYLEYLRSTLTSGRIIALNNGQDTIVCPLLNKQCVDDWTQPLAIFVDANNNLTLESNETLHLKVSNEVIYGYWQKKRSNMKYIKFSPQGHAFGSATTFLYCPGSGKDTFAKQLVINFQGRIRTNSYLNSKGTPYTNVSPLSCL